ncbi:MAG TPA: aminotransferase class IV [Polyangiaceae bacterium]|jgi:branched-chain amino acid aminotransferase|nr:aminotransferase class IV [Polyangiaceae bacterium]
MATTVMIDGMFVAEERALVSVFDRGFLYGDSVFESLRTYGGVPFALDEHLARLERSAARVLIALPVGSASLREEILSAVARHGSAESYVRLTLTRGTGRALGLDPELASEPLRVLLVTTLSPPPAELYERGIAAITFRAERPSDAPAVADAKIGNYLLAVLAMQAARAQGAGEALLEDGSGHILEGSTSNVFAVFAGRLVTAPETAAILPGITRAHALSIAAELGIPIELRSLPKSELVRADEVFISSSIRELVPVVSIDGQRVGPGLPGPITRQLLRRFREAVARR